MATLDAKTVYDKLAGYGNVYNPAGQAYRSTIAGNTVVLYDLNATRVEVRAESVRDYFDKGFRFTEADALKEADARLDAKPDAPSKAKQAHDEKRAKAARAAAAEEARASRPTPAADEDEDGGEEGKAALREKQQRSSGQKQRNEPDTAPPPGGGPGKIPPSPGPTGPITGTVVGAPGAGPERHSGVRQG